MCTDCNNEYYCSKEHKESCSSHEIFCKRNNFSHIKLRRCTYCERKGKWNITCSDCGNRYYCSEAHKQKDTGHKLFCKENPLSHEKNKLRKLIHDPVLLDDQLGCMY